MSTQIYRFTNNAKHFQRNNDFLKQNVDERVAYGSTMQSNNSISYNLKQNLIDDNQSSVYNSQQMTNPSPSFKISRHKSTKSTNYDTWYDKNSTQSIQYSQQYHEDNVPYNRYLKELRNQGTQQSQQKTVILKTTNNNKNNLKKEDINKDKKKLLKLKSRTLENTEYQTFFQKKPLPILNDESQQKKRPNTVQNNIYRQSQQQKSRVKDTNSIADVNRIRDNFDGLEGNNENDIIQEENQIYENMENELEQQQLFDEEGNPIVQENQGLQQENLEQAGLYRSSSQPNINSEGVSDITQSQLNQFIEQNEDYFKHLKGQCACVNDKCGLCKCKYKGIKLKPDILFGASKTVYNQDFSKNKIRKQKDQQNKDLNKQLGDAETIKKLTINDNGWKPDHMKFMSITQRDFQGKFTPKSTICKPKDQKNLDYPLPKSQYQSEFYNYGKCPHELVKADIQRTTMENVPFYNKTTYNDNFIPLNLKEKNKPTRDNWKVSLVKSPVPFLSVTTSQNFYKPYKQKEKIQKYKQHGELDIEDQGNYDGQFKTRYNRDFHQKNKKSCEYKKKQQEKQFSGSQYQSVPNADLLLLQQSLQQTQDFNQFRNSMYSNKSRQPKQNSRYQQF